jgi:hypothetical protein
MVQADAKQSFPLRYLIVSLGPIAVVTWYFLDKISGSNLGFGILILLDQIADQLMAYPQ